MRIDTKVRWMIRRDMPEVMAIEEESFAWPWTEEEYIRCLRQRNAIGMVAESFDRVVGLMIYELHVNRLHLLNFAVANAYRRSGIGTAMMDKIKGKLTPERRNRLMLEVSESNINGCLFLKSQGFTAISVLRGFYESTSGEDAYLFQYRCRESSLALIVNHSTIDGFQ